MVRPRPGAPGLGLRPARPRWRTPLTSGMAGVLALGGVTAGTGCRSVAVSSTAQNSVPAASLAPVSENRTAGPWRTLFDGTTLAGWHNFKTPGAPATGWSAIEGLLVRTGEGGDLVTDREYKNFENDGHPDGKNALTSAGANFALHAAPAGVVKPANSNIYGRAKRGFIALQDHGDRVEFRNIRLRELP